MVVEVQETIDSNKNRRTRNYRSNTTTTQQRCLLMKKIVVWILNAYLILAESFGEERCWWTLSFTCNLLGVWTFNDDHHQWQQYSWGIQCSEPSIYSTVCGKCKYWRNNIRKVYAYSAHLCIRLLFVPSLPIFSFPLPSPFLFHVGKKPDYLILRFWKGNYNDCSLW